MTQINVSQKSFAGGELSPELENRTDLKAYQNALSTSLNVLCTNKGDLIPRPGTEYVSLTSQINTTTNRAPKNARLIPFKISEENSYMLEFTDKRLRIFKDEKPLEGISNTIAMSMRMAPIKSNAILKHTGLSIVNNAQLDTPEAGFLFVRPNRFTHEAGDGPFYFDFDHVVYNGMQLENVPTASTAPGFSFQTVDSSAPGKGSSTEFNSSHLATSSNRFWIHSVERNTIAPTTDRGAQIAGQLCDIVYITDEKENVGIEGAELNLTGCTNVLTDFRWVFENKSITYTGGTSTVSSSSDLDYFYSPYSESELYDIKYESFSDSMYFAHPNYQPRVLNKTGSINFTFNKFYFEGGPWRESSTYGEIWQGAAKAADPSSINPNPSQDVTGRKFPFSTNGEIQWTGTNGGGKNLKENGINTHIHLSDLSASINTSDSGYIADDEWIGRKVRIRFNIGNGSGLTNQILVMTEERQTTSGEVASSNGVLNESTSFLGSSSFDASTFLWAEGVIEKERHIVPKILPIDAKGDSVRVFTVDNPGYLYVGTQSFLVPGDIVELNVLGGGGTLPTHTVVTISNTEPNILKANQFYVHSVIDDERVYICDSYAKINVDGQAFSGSYTSTDETSGTVTAVLRKHTNPTRQFRIKVTKPFGFVDLFQDKAEVWIWLKPSSQTKIGYLFEDLMSDGTGGWPSTVSIFDNRIVFSSTQENPSMMALSAKGDFTNFSPDDGGSSNVNSANSPESDSTWGPLSVQNPRTFSTDSFTYSLQEGTSGPIQWTKTIPQGLVVATLNGIYMSDKPQRNKTYGPGNWKMRFISSEGANSTAPQYIDGKLYYINSRGDKLLSLKYSVEADAFKPVIESLLSEHLFKDGIKEMAFARSPIQVLWLVSKAGYLVSGVILESEEQKAFFKHELAGPAYYGRGKANVKSIAVIPSYDKTFDQLWISTERGLPLADNVTPDTADTAGNFNTIEVLTQYSPYLNDTKEFVGLDLSVSYNSEIRRAGTGADEIVDLDVGSDNNLADQLKIETKVNHGIADGDSSMLINIKGGFSYLNHGALYVADNASGNALLYADVRLDPASFGNASGTASYHIGTRHTFIKSGRVLRRVGTINAVGNTTIGSNVVDADIASYYSLIFNGAFFERGLKFAETKTLSEEYSNGATGVVSTTVKPVSGATNLVGTTYSPASAQGYLFVAGFKPEIYFSSLPPVLNNQLGDMDLNYTFITAVTMQISDSHQIGIRHFGDSISEEYDLVDDLPEITALDQDAVRSSGRYTAQIHQKEEDTEGKLTFYPEAGYPFLIKAINRRGERGSRP